MTYPNSLDTDVDLPRVDSNISDIGELAINSLRSAVFAIEREVGVGGSGTVGSIAARIAIGINADGSFKPSAIVAAGAIVGPVRDADVATNAAIQESKLALTFSTQTLYNLIQVALTDFNTALAILSNLGVDFVRHINGQTPLLSSLNGRHVVSHIDINAEPSDARDTNFSWPSGLSPRNKAGTLRPTNLALFLRDLNGDLVRHLLADGKVHLDNSADQISHPAASVTIDPSGFLIIPPTITDTQKFANYVDLTNFLSITNHQQNMHTNGISRTCRGSVIPGDGYGQPVITYTVCSTFLNHGSTTDDNLIGDDIIRFTPTPDTTFLFDDKFSTVKAGYIITVNYGTVIAQYIIDSVRFTYDGATPPNRTYYVRINGKNLLDTATAVARIDKPLYQDDAKFGVLSVSAINNAFTKLGSLLVANPKGASALGLGFNQSAFDYQHYNLYLQIYPTGNPAEKQLTLPAIDVTGNLGTTPGKYTINSIIDAINIGFSAPGYNYRFQAFNYNGEIGIILADAYLGASFSIISGILNNSGVVIPSTFTNNVVDVPNGIDPLGFGPNGAGIASPQYLAFANINQAVVPTKIFTPLLHKNYYVNGIDRSYLRQPNDGYLDGYGDNYWQATITSKTIVPSVTVKTTYVINQDLSKWDLRAGKTIVVQPAFGFGDGRYLDADYGRFIIDNITCMCPGTNQTTIEVYSGVYGTGNVTSTTSVNIPVFIYFSDDSVAVDVLNVYNTTSTDSFKRSFGVFVDAKGHTFTHERARYDLTVVLASAAPQFSNFDLVQVSPKLKGYGGTGAISNIVLSVTSFDANGNYTGQLQKSGATNLGPLTTSKVGVVTRFFDETNTDFIDVYVDPNVSISAFASATMSIDLFPPLQLDQEVFYIASCQVNDLTKIINRVTDRRMFGNVSERELTTSALDFIGTTARNSLQNGVVRGFDYLSITANVLSFRGGLALVNGKYVPINNFAITIPLVKDNNGGAPTIVTWILCVNTNNEVVLIPITDLTGTPTQTLKLYDVQSTNIYGVDSTTFSNIINVRKDLVPIWKITNNVTNISTYTITNIDCRKFVTDVNGNDFAVLTNGNMQGNFKSFDAVNTWLAFNSAFESTVIVRGIFTPASDPATIGVTYQGDGVGAGFTYSGSTTFQNVTSNNMTYIFTNSFTGNNCIFNNCNITFNSASTLGGSNGGCTFNNCIITIQAPLTFLTATDNINHKLIGCTVTNNAYSGFLLASNVTVTGNYFTNAYNPVGDGTYLSRASNDLVNSQNGLFYAGLTVNNKTIKNVFFTYNTFAVNTASNDHYPHISFEFAWTNCVAQNIIIKNNTVSSYSVSGDLRAAFAFISTVSGGGGGGGGV